jgi:uncharacterized protein
MPDFLTRNPRRRARRTRRDLLLCPTCKTALSIADRSGIEIDFCPSCRGVWLDRGELDKILDRSAATMPPPRSEAAYSRPAPSPVDHRHGYSDHRGHRHPKKKSFLSEIFDFD